MKGDSEHRLIKNSNTRSLFGFVQSCRSAAIDCKPSITFFIRRLVHIGLLYRVSLSLEAPNHCLCIQSNSAGFSFVNTDKQVHLKHARRHFERNLVKDVYHRSVPSWNWLKIYRQRETDLTPADFFLWGLMKGKVYKNTPRTIEQLKDAIRQRFKLSTSTLWEQCSRIWINAFKCAWMWKETSFSIDNEQILFCIVPSMCIYIFKSLSQ